ncbi:MAG: formate--tetrahydrofolate ligase [Candidatus Woesearchaeota archaeon]
MHNIDSQNKADALEFSALQQQAKQSIPPDDEIARNAVLAPIDQIAASAGLLPHEYYQAGEGIAKLKLQPLLDRLATLEKASSRYIVVTAMTPYSLGLGKSVTLVSLVQSLHGLSYETIGAIRQPNLGVALLGVKGGAAGGGYSQIIPMEALNTGLTGDEDRITNANNFAMAAINAYLKRELKNNTLSFSLDDLLFNTYAINAPDAAFRELFLSLDGSVKTSVEASQQHHNALMKRYGRITVATELEGIVSMAKDYQDLFDRLGNVLIAPTNDGFLRFKDIFDHGIHHALAGYLKTALQPNLMQSMNHAPFLVHMGPFANISTGNNSVIADRIGLGLSNYFVTESGFGSDIGFYKLWNVVGSQLQQFPDIAVIVYTLPGLKYHGGVLDIEKRLHQDDPEALKKGFANLLYHLEHVRSYGIHAIPVLNKRHDDQKNDLIALQQMLDAHSLPYLDHDGFAKGQEGAYKLASYVVSLPEPDNKKKGLLYPVNAPFKEKMEAYVSSLGGDPSKITYSKNAEEQIERIDTFFRDLPLCPAKTQTSHTPYAVDPKNPQTHQWLGRSSGFGAHIDAIHIMAGAGYVVPALGNMQILPGMVYGKSMLNKIYFDPSLPEHAMMRGLG